MQDTELYSALLGLRHPWRVQEVKLDLAADRVDVWVEEVTDATWKCPECEKRARFAPSVRSTIFMKRTTRCWVTH